MNIDTTYSYILLAVAIAAIIGVVAWAYVQQKRKQSVRLQQRFGPEYVRAVNELGDRSKAEAHLAERERRVARFTIIALSPGDSAKFRQAWSTLQSRFLDNPKGAVVDADRLVYDLMAKRGYPMGDFEQRAEDISVDHPTVVSNYRAARAIALRDQRGEVGTEDLRKAVIHYRALFQELLEAREPEQPILQRKQATV